jgi:two-component system nitrate/nitrite response regulator NarL
VLGRLPGGAEVLQTDDGMKVPAIVAAHADIALVIVDLRMVATGGLVVVEQLKRSRPELPALVLSSSEDPEDVRRALAAGARGYCPKSCAPATLQAAIQLVLAGEMYVPPLMALATAAEPPLGSPQAAVTQVAGLTPRQREVLQSLARGHSNKQVARELGMEEKTVKGHVSAIFRALKVVHRMQAVEAARNAGLLE